MNSKRRNQLYFNNTILEVCATQSQAAVIHDFANSLSTTHSEQFRKLMKYLLSPITISRDLAFIDTPDALSSALEELQKDQYLVIQDYNEYIWAYKGRMSCLAIGNSNHSYLIDCIALRPSLGCLAKVLEDPKIIKLMYNSALTMQNLKREFSIFLCNHYSLKNLEEHHKDLEDAQNPQSMKSYSKKFCQLLSEKQNQLFQRPFSNFMMSLLRNTYITLTKYAKKIGAIPASMNNQWTREFYDEFIINSYVSDCTEMQKITAYIEHVSEPYTSGRLFDLAMNTPNPFQQRVKYVMYDEKDSELIQHSLKKLLFEGLVGYRDHLAKLIDLNPCRIFPNSVIYKLVDLCTSEKYLKDRDFSEKDFFPVSIIQIQEKLREYIHLPVKLIDVWEVSKQIEQIIQLCNDRFEEMTKIESKIGTRLGQFIYPDGSRLKSPYLNHETHQFQVSKLLNHIDWKPDSQWLNNPSDPAIRLYKEILSFKEFDHSITEEFNNYLNPDILSIQEVSKYLKFANYMRDQNILDMKRELDRLQADKQKMKASSGKREGDFTDSDDDQFPSENIPTKASAKTHYSLERKFHSLNSMTSLEERLKESNQALKKKMHVDQKEETSMQIVNMEENQINRAYIKPLPIKVSEIYELALQMKKTLGGTSAKKKNKKKKEEVVQPNEFVPTLQHIKNLLPVMQ